MCQLTTALRAVLATPENEPNCFFGHALRVAESNSRGIQDVGIDLQRRWRDASRLAGIGGRVFVATRRSAQQFDADNNVMQRTVQIHNTKRWHRILVVTI